MQHLLGHWDFLGRRFKTDRRALIPRPETELIIEIAADSLEAARLVVDLCAGSGAIALSVAKEFAAERVIAVERSEVEAFLRRALEEG